MQQEENGGSSTSAISLDRLQNHLESADAPEVDPEPEPEMQPSPRRVTMATKKRKRTSFASPRKDKHYKDIFNMLRALPQINQTFSICDKIGEGTFSSVYRGRLRQNEESTKEFALKHIIPTSHPDRILSELSCLLRIGGKDNVMGVELTIREKDTIVIVMPYFRHSRFQDFYHDMDVKEVQEYMRNLFVALRRVHEFNVIHRDVKPGNFLYNRDARKYALVDFGLAQAVPKVSKSKMSKKASTLGGVLHHDTPRPPQPRKNVRRVQSTSENKIEPTAECNKRMQSESRSTAPRLVELDPNTFDPSEKSSRDRNHSHHDEDLKKGINQSLVIPRGSENNPEVLTITNHKKEAENPKPVILTRRCTAGVVRRGVKKVLKEPSLGVGESRTSSLCGCFGVPQVCDVCMSRKNQVAPRAGTPGFRSPEVLLKCPDQTTAVDMWAAGVILLSILSGRYPFFRAPDDLMALAQIMSIMGTEETKAAADLNGKNLQCSVKLPAMDLQVMCRQLRFGATQHPENNGKRRRSNGESSKRRRRSNGLSPPQQNNAAASKNGDKDVNGSPESQKSVGSTRSETSDQADLDRFPDSAYDLLNRLLELNPKKRISAIEALKHPFITEAL